MQTVIFGAIFAALVASQATAEEKKESSFKLTGQFRLDHRTTETVTDGVSASAGGFVLNRARIVWFEFANYPILSIYGVRSLSTWKAFIEFIALPKGVFIVLMRFPSSCGFG